MKNYLAKEKSKKEETKLYTYPGQGDYDFKKPYTNFVDLEDMVELGCNAEVELNEACSIALEKYENLASKEAGVSRIEYIRKAEKMKFLMQVISKGNLYFEPYGYNKNKMIYSNDKTQILGIKEK